MAVILIVDDEPINREFLAACLEGPDHQLWEAASGEQALTIATMGRAIRASTGMLMARRAA